MEISSFLYRHEAKSTEEKRSFCEVRPYSKMPACMGRRYEVDRGKAKGGVL